MSDSMAPGDVIQPCPLEERFALEVLVLGTDNQPVDAVRARLQMSDDQTADRRTGADGMARFDGLIAGSYSITLPAHDRDAWRFVRAEPLDAPARKSSGDIAWTAPEDPGSQKPYTALEGDCLSSIAYNAGFAPETIWNDGANAELKARRASMHVLLPGDVVAIPKKRKRMIGATTGKRYVFQLVSVPEILRIRFVTHNLKPRTGVPYLLQIETADGKAVPSRKGETGGDGFLVEPIPPDAARGEILLGSGLDVETYPLRLGYIDPCDDVRGAQGRLNNLGYHCGEADGKLNDLTRQAIEQFQRDFKLPASGQCDATTQAKLISLYRS